MATVARRFSLMHNVGETLLSTKLQILSGTGNRRPSIALSILTGRVVEQLSILESFYAADPAVTQVPTGASVEQIELRARPHFVPRTVYLSEKHLTDIEAVVDVLARYQIEPKHLTRSAVLRRAVEFMRNAIEADPAKFVLENE
jgi:hypothetical protein